MEDEKSTLPLILINDEDDGPSAKGGLIIDDRFNEILFRLWMSGKTTQELFNIYRGSPNEFSLDTLRRSMRRNKWKERREEIVTKIREQTDEDVQLYTTQKLRMLHQIIALTDETIEREYKEFVKNPIPKNRPSWLPSNIKDIDSLFRLHEFLASGGVDKHLFGIKGQLDIGESSISDNTAVSILKLLSEATTQQLIDQSKNNRAALIPAEFTEIKEESVEETTVNKDLDDGDEVADDLIDEDLNKLKELAKKNDKSTS